MKGKLIVISAPSGAGKTTIIRRLLRKNPDLVLSVSSTTRKKRLSEKEGVDYCFISLDQFNKLREKDQMLESALVHGFYYGTPKKPIDDWMAKGKTVILDVDVQGGEQIKKIYPFARLVFISPPSMEELKQRITKRGENDESDIDLRMKNAEKELKKKYLYDFEVINNDVDQAVLEIEKIICSV